MIHERTNANANIALPMDDSAMRSKFGFDRADDSWLDQCRRARDGPAPSRLGAYELLAEAGRGGQGSVYKAVQPRTGRVVAIKRLGAGRLATAAMRVRFEREVRALASLSHPGVVTVFGADEVDGQRVLLMEWIDGAPIDEWARSRPLRERLAAFALVCDAVHHAHQRGVIHRDLKPSNILVDAAGRPRVLDFGLARLLEDEGVAPGSWGVTTTAFVGTPAYAAPEQVAGQAAAADTRTDVYALGVILYELLTGTRPFERGTDMPTLMHSIRNAEPRRPSALDADVGPELDAIALKALAKEPDRRYQSVEALGDDVRRFLRGEPVAAHPPSAVYYMRKFVGRHRAGVAAAGVAALALVGGAAATGWQGFRAMRAEAGTLRERDTARLEARRAVAVRTFLTEMLGEAEPGKSKYGELTVREALDRAAARLDAGAFRDEPEIEAAVRQTLANTYTRLSERRSAAAQFEWLVRHWERTTGRGSAEHRNALYWLAAELNGAGNYAAAERALLEHIDLERRAGGSGVRRAMLTLGEVQMRLDRLDEAEQTLRGVLASPDGAGPAPPGRITTWALLKLAWVRTLQGYLDEAAALYDQAAPLVERDFASDGQARVMFRSRYASDALHARGLDELAMQHLSETIVLGRQMLGPGHPETIIASQVLGRVLLGQARFAEARTLLVEAADAAAGVHESSARRIAPTLAASLVLADDPAGAAEVCARFSISEDRVARELRWAATNMLARDRAAQAERALRLAIEMHRRTPDRADQLAASLTWLGRTLLDLGRPGEAEPVLREAMAVFGQMTPVEPWRIAEAGSVLGAALGAQGRAGEAEQLLLPAFDVLDAVQSQQWKEREEALERVVQFYESRGEPERAAAYRDRRDATARTPAN